MESQEKINEKKLPYSYLGVGFSESKDNDFANIIEKSIIKITEKFPNDKDNFKGINILCDDIKNGEMERLFELSEEANKKQKKNKKLKNLRSFKEIIDLNILNEKKNEEIRKEENIEEQQFLQIKKERNKSNMVKSDNSEGISNQLINNEIKKKEEEILKKETKIPLIKNNEIEEEKKIYKLPKHFHITTLFKSKKGFDKEKEAYKQFEENKETIVKIFGIVIIPFKTIIFILKTKEKSDNKIPHITAAVNEEFKPKNSNDVMENLFNEDKEYFKVYHKLMQGENFEFIEKGKIEVLGKIHNFYINIFKQPFDIKGKLQGFKS